MLDPKLLTENIQTNADSQSTGNHEINMDKAQELQGINNEGDEDEKKSVDNKDKSEAIIADEKLDQTMNHEVKDENNDVQLKEELIEDNPKDDEYTTEKEKGIESEPITKVRISQRIRKQRMVIQPDQIGDCDDTKDIDYR